MPLYPRVEETEGVCDLLNIKMTFLIRWHAYVTEILDEHYHHNERIRDEENEYIFSDVVKFLVGSLLPKASLF
jgi:hypothetical protein